MGNRGSQTRFPIFFRAAAVLLLIGMTLGTWFDSFHSHSGTLTYANPFLWQEAWWVPLLFGAAAVAGALGQLQFARARGWNVRKRPWFAVIAGLGCFGIQYYLSAYWDLKPAGKIGSQALMAFGIWFAFSRSASGLGMALMVAVIGCAVESTLTGLGLFHYAKPDIARVPYWLPFLYISFAVVILNLGRVLVDPLPDDLHARRVGDDRA